MLFFIIFFNRTAQLWFQQRYFSGSTGR